MQCVCEGEWVWHRLTEADDIPGPKTTPTLLHTTNSLVLFAGGISGGFHHDVYQYTFSKSGGGSVDSAWKKLESHGQVAGARMCHIAWLPSDTRMVVATGIGKGMLYDTTLHCYNIKSGVWSIIPTDGDAPGPRSCIAFYHHPGDSKALFYGGMWAWSLI